MQWSLISATNNDAILQSCLLNSPATKAASEIILQRGFASAACAYNAAIDKAKTDILVFVHQDVYLPENWAASLQETLVRLSSTDPNWGVLGIWGIDRSFQRKGHLYCNASGGIYGRAFEHVYPTRTLDEVLIIVRKSSGLRFDDQQPGYHLYATDICLEAESRGMRVYAISAFCFHNADTYKLLPASFWKNYLFIRRKWKSALPVVTPCISITKWCTPILLWNAFKLRQLLFKRQPLRKRVADPASVYRAMIK